MVGKAHQHEALPVNWNENEGLPCPLDVPQGYHLLFPLLVFLPSYTLVDTRHIKMFVLDEADEMLSRGFKDQIYDVFRKLPSTIQVRTGVGGMAHYSLVIVTFYLLLHSIPLC